MNDNLIIALEAAWELDPVRLENKLWKTVERVSNQNTESVENRALAENES